MAVKNKSIFAVAGLGLALIAGCSRAPASRGGGPVPVLAAAAAAMNVPVLIDPPPVGHVTPVSTVTIHSQIGGIISEVHFKGRLGGEIERFAFHD